MLILIILPQNLDIFCFFVEWIKGLSTAFIEFAEELYVLKSTGMYEGAQGVDCDVIRMSDDKSDGHYEYTQDPAAGERAHRVNNRRDYRGRKTQGQKSGIGQNI